MKRIILFLFAIAVAVIASAQSGTADYMKKIPALPRDSCDVTKANAENFTAQVNTLLSQIESDLEMLNKKVNDKMKNNTATAQENAMNQMSQQYGISQADLEKMKNSKNMSAEEKKALANKIMQQQTNMTVDEAKSVGKMSEAGKKAYAEAYAAEAMATAQTDPNQQAKNESAKNSYELLKAQQDIQVEIAKTNQKISDLYASIENDPDGQKMLKNIETWQSKLMSMTGIDYGQGDQMDSLSLLIKTEKIKYCNKFTPRYRSALRQHLKILKASLPEFNNLADITAKVTLAQTGISMPPEGQEIPGLGAIEGYLNKLKEVFKFKLYYADEGN
jgi:hypothetical protein